MTRFHGEMNAVTGEYIERPYTPEEESVADALAAEAAKAPDPIAELAAFLKHHPDVAALLSQK